MALPLGGVMLIDPLELFGDYHLTPTRGRIKTVNWNLKGAPFPSIPSSVIIKKLLCSIPSSLSLCARAPEPPCLNSAIRRTFMYVIHQRKTFSSSSLLYPLSSRCLTEPPPWLTPSSPLHFRSSRL